VGDFTRLYASSAARAERIEQDVPMVAPERAFPTR
jgi:hypothetical protein